MSDTISIHPYNASKLKVDSEYHILQGLYDHFGFLMPNARFHPKVKAKQWDGIIRLFDVRSRTLPVGLLPRLMKYAKQADANVDFSNYRSSRLFPKVTIEEVQEFADSLDIHSQGKKITPHDYQIDAVHHALKNGRCVAIAPTSAGKSLILYIYLNWMKRHDLKCLLIVPSVQLVHQMFGDFADYENGAKHITDDCHLIMSGEEKQTNKLITISTWQSLQNIAKIATGTESKPKKDAKRKPKVPISREYFNFCQSFFQQFDVVANDETHGCTGSMLTLIMDQCINAHTRLGVTGTLDGSEIMPLVLEGIFGPIHVVTTTKELMDRGAVSTIDIKCLILDYPESEKALCKKITYHKEIDYLVANPKRLKFMTNLVTKLDGNTLLLFNLVAKHGKPLYDAIKAKVGDSRKVFFIHGGVDGEERDQVRAIVEKEDDAIIVASYKTMSTGTSIRRLHNVVFGSPSKSQIRVLQSIGRGLRLGNDKNHCILYDIADDLQYKKKKNYTLEHFIERVKIYSSQQFNYKMIKIPVN